MTRTLSVQSESWPLKHPFRIARGMKTEATVVVATISENSHGGRGECVPYARYGKSVQGVIAQINSVRHEIESGISRHNLQSLLPAGAARNALDCALIDLQAKTTGRPAFELLGLPPPAPARTAFTLSVDEPEAMGRAAGEATACGYRLLKLKVAGGEDIARVQAVRCSAPDAKLIVDANEGWSPQDYEALAPGLAELGVALIEQPLKAGHDDYLATASAPVPLCARRELPHKGGSHPYPRPLCLHQCEARQGRRTDGSGRALP